jgi:transposase, IS5 family
MIRYTSQHQLRLIDFKTPFEQNLSPDNRWVILASVIPWDEMAGVYHRQMSSNMGRGSIDTRVVIGAMIIKHMLKLDDREVVHTLQENIYLQYFVGFSSFQTKIAFDPSLLVTFRKRMGPFEFDEWSLSIIKQIETFESTFESAQLNQKESENPTGKTDKIDTDDTAKFETPISLKDTLIIDTTVAEQKIKYPTDIDLLNDVRVFTESLIDTFYKLSPLTVKPRSYREIARKDYLNTALKRKKSQKVIRKAIKKQLGYIERNLLTINDLWTILEKNNIPIPFTCKTKVSYKKWLVCQEIYRQQRQMSDRHVNKCDDRIVSIDQPQVRPILRGKAAKKTEFGSKVALSIVNGTNRIFKISWDAYNDGVDLIGQVEAYKKQYQQYPKLVLADKIYMTHANRAYLKKNNIQHRGQPLGRPKKDKQGQTINPYSKIQLKEANQRNHVEGQFGTAKDAYDLNKVKAKTEPTSESWIANIFFILNIVKLLKLAQKAMATSVCLVLNRLKLTFFQYQFNTDYNNYRFYC